MPLFKASATIYLDCNGSTAMKYFCDLTPPKRASITDLCFPKYTSAFSAHIIIRQIIRRRTGWDRLACITLWPGFKATPVSNLAQSLVVTALRSNLRTFVLWSPDPVAAETEDVSQPKSDMERLYRHIFRQRFSSSCSIANILVVHYERRDGPPINLAAQPLSPGESRQSFHNHLYKDTSRLKRI